MISVVIPSFQRRDSVLGLLASVYRQRDIELEVIVVDDNSSDGTVASIRHRFPQTRVLCNHVNCGPCVSRNRGIREARGDIIVGLDSDVTLPDADVLARVEFVFSRSPGKFGVAFRVIDSDGMRDDGPRWWHPVPMEHFAARQFETNYFSGTAYAFRREELIEVGLFPEAIFQYFEEVEVAYRFLDSGGVMLYVPELAVLHNPGARSGWSDHRFFHNPRSQVLLVVACYPALRGFLFLAPRLVWSFLRAVIGGRASLFAKGLVSGFIAIPARMRERKPLRRTTWRRMSALGKEATLRRQVIPMEGAKTKIRGMSQSKQLPSL